MNTLDGYLKNNNLNIVRLILSSMVIVGHSYAIAPTGGKQDIISVLTGVTYSGALAVKAFFFISGLLVCNSIINNSNPLGYIISRFFRIIPALLVMLLITCFIIGPIVSELSFHDYISNNQVLTYLSQNINLFKSAYYYLPGVFVNNHYPNAVNGSLWTLSYEVEMYMYLLCFSLLGLLNHKRLVTYLLIFVIALPSLDLAWYHNIYGNNSEVYYLPMCFSLGCIFALWKKEIKLNLDVLIGLIIFSIMMNELPIFPSVFYLSSFYFILWFSDRRYFNFPSLKVDISYGVYIYGFLIQQLVSYYFPDEGFLFNSVISLAICYPIAYLSYVLIEEPSINFGRFIKSKIKWVGNRVVEI